MSKKSERSRELRRDPSRAERICWELIRAHRLEGIKFRRQHPIDRYFADFACVSRKLIIEIDGHHHADQVEADAQGTAVMERHGWRVVRFAANEVEGASPPLLASPPSGGEELEERGIRVVIGR